MGKAGTQSPVPVTLLGGYLGAGKTTLINQALAESVDTGHRLAVLVNDLGTVNVDAELIVSQSGDTIELANGCVCCGVEDGFAEAFATLAERSRPPSQVIIELSGVADPNRVRGWATAPGYTLDGVLVAVDTEQFVDRSRDRWVGDTVIRQVRAADLLVLTKVDLATPERQIHTRGHLRAMAPSTPLLGSAPGSGQPSVLLNQMPRSGPGANPAKSSGADDSEELHQAHVHTGSFQNAAAPEAFLDQLSTTVVRAKGILLAGPDLVEVQVVGTRRTITPAPSGAEDTGLVIIEVPAARPPPA